MAFCMDGKLKYCSENTSASWQGVKNRNMEDVSTNLIEMISDA